MEKTLSLCRLAGITGTGGLFAFGQHILAVADARLLCGKDVGVKRPALLLLPVVRVIVPPQEKVTLVRALRAAFSVRPGIDSGEQQEIINAHPEGCGFWAQLFSYTGLRLGEANSLPLQRCPALSQQRKTHRTACFFAFVMLLYSCIFA